MLSAGPPRRRISTLGVILFALILLGALAAAAPWIQSSCYEARDELTLRLDGLGFVTLDAKGQPSSSAATSLTLLDGRVITQASFTGEKLTLVLFEKRWSWLPLPRYRSRVSEE